MFTCVKILKLFSINFQITTNYQRLAITNSDWSRLTVFDMIVTGHFAVFYTAVNFK